MSVAIASEAGATASVVVALLGGITALVSGVAAGLFSFVVAIRQARASTEAARTQAEAMIEAAQHASGAETFVPSSARFASWQMHKRELYGTVLEALRIHVVKNNDESREKLQQACTPALLVAESPVRERLYHLGAVEVGPSAAVDYQELVEIMVKDIDPVKK